MLTVSAVQRVLADVQEAVWFGTDQDQRAAVAREEQGQADLFRDLFGSLPFRPLPPITPSVLAWNDGTVRRLAEEAYRERLLPQGRLDLQRLAVLADALEEAGCTDADFLGQLRGPGPHVRGCWPLDLCLGKS